MIARPKMTAAMVATMRAGMGSPRNTRLNIAANTGIEAKMNTTLATLVLVTANTKAGAVVAISSKSNATQEFRYLFWPRSDSPLLVIQNLSDKHKAIYGKIRLRIAEPGEPQNSIKTCVLPRNRAIAFQLTN